MRMTHLTVGLVSVALAAASGCAGLAFEEGDVDDAPGGAGGATPNEASSSTGSGDGAPTNKRADEEGGIFTDPIEEGDPLFPTPNTPEPMCAIEEPWSKTVDQAFPSIGDTASAPWARALLAAGALPERSLLRTQEFLSYFTPPHDGPPRWELAVVGSPQSSTIDISVRAAVPAVRDEPLRIVLLVDLSPTMRPALPIVESLVEALPEGLERPGDQLGVFTYAADLVELAPLDEPAKAPVEVAAKPLAVRAGNDLTRALAGVADLGFDEPVHVLLVTDGGVALDPALLEARSVLLSTGSDLSVALVGKPGRPGADAAPFPRAFADALAGGRGRTFYLPDAAEPARAFSSAAVAKAFGEPKPSEGFVLTLPAEFEVLGNVYVEKPASDAGAESAFGGGAPSLTPGATHPTWLRGSFCNTGELFVENPALAQDALTLLLDVDVPGADSPEGTLEPTEWQVVSLDAPTPGGRDALFDLAVFGVLEVLRQRDPAGVPAARDAIERAEEAAGCVGNPVAAPHCASLVELEQMLDDASSLL